MKAYNSKFIDTYINMVCEDLEIKKPNFVADKFNLPTPTSHAVYLPDKNCVYYNNDIDLFDLIFAFTHELRHVWQMQYYEDKFFSDYKQRNELNLYDYNLQPAEFDANVFATVYVMSYLGIKPLFLGFSDVLRNKIYNSTFTFLEKYKTRKNY